MKTQLLKSIHDSRQYTLSVAELMPEQHYNSVIAKDAWSFLQLMNHIAYGLTWWESNFIRKKELAWEPPNDKATKKEIIKLLSDGFNSLEKIASSSTASDKLTLGIWATLDHVTHHRGQAVLHLRNLGLTPPEYVGISL
ncbi:MAG: DinB family protein [Chryseolinea sp.]